MADEAIRPPDQVSAGATPEAPDQAGIVNALRSLGPPPQAALQNIMQPMPGPNMGSAFGSGALAGLAGQPGQNPYLQQQQHSQSSLFYQQLNMQREQDRRADRAFKQNEATLEIEKGLLDTLPDSPLRNRLAEGYAKKVGQYTGNPLIGQLGAAIATKKLSPDDVNGILMDGAQKMDPQLIALRHPNVPVQRIQQILQTDPKTLERIGADSESARKSKLLDQQIKEATLAEKNHPELKGDAKTVQAMIALHRKLYGKDYMEGDSQTQAKAYELAHAQSLAEEEKMLRLKSQLDVSKAIEIATIKASVVQQKPLTPMQKTKAIEPISRARNTMGAVQKLEQIVDSMPEDVFPKGEDMASQLWAKGKRATMYRGNSALQQFEQWWGPVSIGQIDRGMFDEKGVRAIQAFSKQVGMVDNLPPRKAVKDYIQTVKDNLTRKMGEDVQDMEDLNYPPDVTSVARKIYEPYAPKGARPPGGKDVPPGPLAPPADLTYDPKTKTWGKP